MKKLGKRLSFLTKIMLVAGLLISNLSSLSVVFAAETTIFVDVVDEKLNIKYLDELAGVESVRLDIVEKYTYLDNEVYKDSITNETEFDNEGKVLTPEELDMLLSDEKVLVIDDTILPNVIFDGIYEVKIELYDVTDKENEVLIDTCDFGTVVIHNSGLEVSVVDSNGALSISEDGKYIVNEENTEVMVGARLLSGGINPTDKFMYNNTPMSAMEVLNLSFGGELDFTGRLFGDYTQPIEVELSKLNENNEYELMEFDEEEININLLYGTYEKNAQMMNETVLQLGLDSSYNFASTTENGVMYMLLDATKVNTMWDLYSIVNSRFSEDSKVRYVLSNSQYEDVLSILNQEVVTEETTDSVVEGENGEGTTEEEFDLEGYLKNIVLDDTAMVSLINDGLTITYKVLVVGDTNNDNKLTNEDLLDLINQVIGEKEVNVEKSDLYGNDSKVNTLDVMKLDQVIKNNNWDISLNEQLDISVDSELYVGKNDIVSGEEFTVNYIVKLSDYMINGVSGLFTYDNEAFELVSVETANDWLGNSKDGKFLYIGEESLELPEVSESEDDVVLPEDGCENVDEENIDSTEEVAVLEETEEIVITKDYVVVSATFVAKKAGTHTISVENLEYFNQDTYYGVEETPVSVDVVVNASDNNNLSSLIVAGQTITLVDGQLDYEITVSNETTVAEVNAIVENIAANITSIVSPEELVEGENTVMITVESESGDVKVYTVKVIREAAPEEEETTTQVNYDNYYNDYEDDGEQEGEVIGTEPEDEEEDDDKDTTKEEESNLSRIVIIILILLVIAGLIYLIFKDEDDDKEETRKVNKEVNKLRKEEKEPEIKKEVKPVNKVNNKTNNKNSSKNTKNKKN